MKNNVLYFEGAGWDKVESNGVGNCRIRTAFTNLNGDNIYLEIIQSGRDRTKGFIDFCYKITNDNSIDDCNESRLGYDKKIIDYTKESILNFINNKLNCKFKQIKVLNTYGGYRVFNSKGEHNTYSDYHYGDKFEYNEEVENARKKKGKELHEKFKKIFNQKYDNTSIYPKENDGISRKLNICINVSDEERIKAGYKDRRFTIEF